MFKQTLSETRLLQETQRLRRVHRNLSSSMCLLLFSWTGVQLDLLLFQLEMEGHLHVQLSGTRWVQQTGSVELGHLNGRRHLHAEVL